MTDTAQQAANAERNMRRVLQGTVTSDKMDKTITVLVERRFAHPKYGKFVKKHKKYHAHDETNTASVGDVVEIVAMRPMSKLKRWRLQRVLESDVLAAQGLTEAERPELSQPQSVQNAEKAAAAEAEAAAEAANPEGGDA